MRHSWDIVTVIHSVLAIIKAPTFYKASQQSESLRAQISCTNCRQCPSQRVWGAATLQVTRGGVERGLANVCLETTNSMRKVRSHSFSVPAVSRLLLFALYTVHCALFTGTKVHPFWEWEWLLRTLWVSGVSASLVSCLLWASAPWSHLPLHDRECPTRNLPLHERHSAVPLILGQEEAASLLSQPCFAESLGLEFWLLQLVSIIAISKYWKSMLERRHFGDKCDELL